MIELTHDIIDHARLTDAVRRDNCGAVVVFLGTVRDLTGDVRTLALEYQAYPVMASKMMTQLEIEARERWPIGECLLVHRLGRLTVGEISVGVAVSCPHRADAFDACEYLIDRLKEIVPIWKQENHPDGHAEWVHPGL